MGKAMASRVDMDLINPALAEVCGPLTSIGVRRAIERLETLLAEGDQVEIPVSETFSGGIYAREIIIPEGTLLTGRIYKVDHYDVMVYGDVTVSSEDGLKRIEGFHCFTGNKGKKRAGYAHKETKWITFCASPRLPEGQYLDYLTARSFADLDKDRILERIVPEKRIEEAYNEGYGDYETFRTGYLAGQYGKGKREMDQDDYLAFCESLGPDAKGAIEVESFTTWNKVKCDGVAIKTSSIHGYGLFATRRYVKGSKVITACLDGAKTQGGRFANHSIIPNAVMVWNGLDIDLVALELIEPGEEITVSYRESFNLHREADKCLE